MKLNKEYEEVYQKLKGSSETLEDILYQSFRIPVDHCSKAKPSEIAFPDTEDNLQNIKELMNIMNRNLEQVEINIRQFWLNKFQIIKEEEFDPKNSQPLVDYEIVQNVEQAKIDRMKQNANRLSRQIIAYQQKQI